jgi:hypothetical protein
LPETRLIGHNDRMRRHTLFGVTATATALLVVACTSSSDSRSGDGGGGEAGGGEAGAGGVTSQTGGKGGTGARGGSGGSTAKAGTGGTTSSSGGSGGTATGGTATGGTATGGTAAGGTGGTVTAGTGGTATGGTGTGGAATGGMGGTVVASNKITYTFESTTEGWAMSLGSKGMGLPDPTQVALKGRIGTGALEYVVDPALGTTFYVGVEGNSIVRPVTRITYYLYLPVNHGVTLVEAFMLGFGDPQGRKWESVNQGKFPFVPGGWTKFVQDFAIPYPVSPFGNAVGFMFVSDTIWKGSVYIDDIEIEMVPAP